MTTTTDRERFSDAIGTMVGSTDGRTTRWARKRLDTWLAGHGVSPQMRDVYWRACQAVAQTIAARAAQGLQGRGQQ